MASTILLYHPKVARSESHDQPFAKFWDVYLIFGTDKAMHFSLAYALNAAFDTGVRDDVRDQCRP